MKSIFRGTSCAAATLLLASPAVAGRPMTIKDLIGAVRVSDPQLSPDGRLVAFVRTTTDVSTGARNADIWVVPADGSGPPRLLVGGEKSENTPRWSPDGKHFAFISTRASGGDLFIADADGNNVRQITRLPSGENTSGGCTPASTFVRARTLPPSASAT